MSTSECNVEQIEVVSENVTYTADEILSRYQYDTTRVKVLPNNRVQAEPTTVQFEFKTNRKAPAKLGCLLVGWGGNNGSTMTAGILANKLNMEWRTSRGIQKADYLGSLTQCATVRLGIDEKAKEVFVPLKSIVPFVSPNDLVVGGWDINSADLSEAMERACVLDYDLQRQLKKPLSHLKPMPSIYYPDFIAGNQFERADNLIPGSDKQKHLEQIRADIRRFKQENELEKVIILWTANTERFCDVQDYHLKADTLLEAIARSEEEISASTIFAVASILEGCPYINGSPQNTFVPGVIELSQQRSVPISGDDFKTGQTKLKSVLVDYLVSAGLKPQSIVSYNHLGNNDGRNLSAPQQFRSKEISKSNVVDDMVAANGILYPDGQKPDHCVVIKYVPYVGDSKRAMDEYTSSIFLGGHNTLVIHNTCEDSCLAAPLMIDLILLCELMTRIQYRSDFSTGNFESFNPVFSILSYLLKAPVVPAGAPVINSLARQRACIENVLKACVGLKPENSMGLEFQTKWQFSNSSSTSPSFERRT